MSSAARSNRYTDHRSTLQPRRHTLRWLLLKLLLGARRRGCSLALLLLLTAQSKTISSGHTPKNHIEHGARLSSKPIQRYVSPVPLLIKWADFEMLLRCEGCALTDGLGQMQTGAEALRPRTSHQIPRLRRCLAPDRMCILPTLSLIHI